VFAKQRREFELREGSSFQFPRRGEFFEWEFSSSSSGV
jgi:hypothetical protein